MADTLPYTNKEFEILIKQTLSNAKSAIHLFVDSWGITVGGNTEPIVGQQLRLARKMRPAQTNGLCSLGGDETAKRRFFQEKVLLKTIAALPNKRDEARKLLASLDILSPKRDEP